MSGNWIVLAGRRGPWGVGRRNPRHPVRQSPLIHYHGRGQKRQARPHRSARLGPRARRGGRGRLRAHAGPSCPAPRPRGVPRAGPPRLAADLRASEGGRTANLERSEGPNPARRPPGGVECTPKRPRARNVTVKASDQSERRRCRHASRGRKLDGKLRARGKAVEQRPRAQAGGR